MKRRAPDRDVPRFTLGDTIGSALDTRCLHLIGCLAALVMASEAGAGALFPGQKFPTGNRPQSVAAADLDDDGNLDLITANSTVDDVSVLLGNGDGTFQAAVRFSVSGTPLSVAVADLEGDGAPDLHRPAASQNQL